VQVKGKEIVSTRFCGHDRSIYIPRPPEGGEPYTPPKRYRVAGAGKQDLRHSENKPPTGMHAIEVLSKSFSRPKVSCELTH
jgi:hypothetical protein